MSTPTARNGTMCVYLFSTQTSMSHDCREFRTGCSGNVCNVSVSWCVGFTWQGLIWMSDCSTIPHVLALRSFVLKGWIKGLAIQGGLDEAYISGNYTTLIMYMYVDMYLCIFSTSCMCIFVQWQSKKVQSVLVISSEQGQEGNVCLPSHAWWYQGGLQ